MKKKVEQESGASFIRKYVSSWVIIQPTCGDCFSHGFEQLNLKLDSGQIEYPVNISS